MAITEFQKMRNRRLLTLFPDFLDENYQDEVNFSDIVAEKYKGKRVLEISPCFFPLLDKSDYFELSYCDRIEFDEINNREKENQFRKDLGLSVLPIDFILQDGKWLSECTLQKYDLIVSSHVMEHVPNWISWLWGHYDALSDNESEIRMILPDAANSGEYIRRLSTSEYALECYINKIKMPTPSQVYGALLYITDWKNEKPKRDILEYKRWYGFEEAARHAVESFERYIDIHCWAWTSDSLRDDVTILNASGVLPYKVRFVRNGTMPNAVCDEFSICLKKDNSFKQNEAISNYMAGGLPKSSAAFGRFTKRKLGSFARKIGII